MAVAYSPLLAQLIEALKCLPGVGAKSAQRMAFHLLDKDRTGAENLARSLQEAANRIQHCRTAGCLPNRINAPSAQACGGMANSFVSWKPPPTSWPSNSPLPIPGDILC